MSDPIGNERLFGFLNTALNAASLRHQVISANLANIDTPGYKARDLEFEQILRDYEDQERMALPRRPEASPQAPAPPELNFKDYFVEETAGHLTHRFDGNNVDLEKEMGKMAAARGRYKLALTFMSRKIRLINETINSRV